MAVGVFGYGPSAPKPVSQTNTANKVSSLFSGEPAPFLPQIERAIPDPVQLASTFEKLAPAGAPTSFFDQAKSFVSNLPQAPVVTAPVVAPVTVAFPEGDANRLQSALFESQFQPVRRELERRGGQEDQQLNAALAQAGLADSGTGIGQRQDLQREVGEQIGSAASAISESATAKALEAKLAVATQQANIDIQRNLANAQLDIAAQQTNARNILERGAFEGNALLAALGLDAQQAENTRANFLSFIDSQTQAALRQSEVARAALADIFSAVLQEQALGLRSQEIALGERRLATETGLAKDGMAQGQAQFDQNLALQERQLALQEQQLANPLNQLREMGINPADAIGPAPVQPGGRIAHASYLSTLGKRVLGTGGGGGTRADTAYSSILGRLR